MKTDDAVRMAESLVEQDHVECDYLEYKKSATFKASILKTACAFANNYMNREVGLILVGIEELDEDDGRKAVPKRPISGIEDALIETTENVLKSLLAEVHPKIEYHMTTGHADGRSFIVVAVEPGTAGPYETSERAQRSKDIGLKAGRYIRIGRDTRLPNKREEFELLKKFSGFCFSSELNATATLDDLNYEYMREYLAQTGARDDMRSLSKLDMAKSMGLVDNSEYGGYRARNFAVLMFADRPQDFIPYARTEIIREADGTDKMEAKVFDGPVWIQVQQARRYFEQEIQASYTIRETGARKHRIIYNWPHEMFDELVTNCALHKEYDSRSYIGVYVYPDKMTFVNHNRPLPPVTIQDLNEREEFDDRDYLNPELKDMFFALDLIESYGSGIRRAKRAMAANGSPALVFTPDNETDDYTMATAYINAEFASIRAGEAGGKPASNPPAIRQEGGGTVDAGHSRWQALRGNERIVCAYLEEHGESGAAEIAGDLNIKRRTLGDVLTRLADKGIVEPLGQSVSRTYRLLD